MTRGVKNAFRNPLRTGAVVVILAIGIGLSLSMLVAQQAIADRITQLQSNLGSTITINPAGARGFEGGGEPLTSTAATKAEAISHVSSVTGSLTLRLRNQTTSTGNGGPGGISTSATTGTTNLNSSIDAGTLGRRNSSSTESGTGTALPAFSLPITAVGVSGATDASGAQLTLTAGRVLADTDKDTDVAVIGSGLATKNSLSVGSTFTAYDKTFTVVGIFNATSAFENGQLYLPISTAQTLSAQADEYSSIVVSVDSLENVDSTVANLKSVLGTTVDVTSSQQNAQTAIDSLTSVRNVSLIGFFASLIAAGVIIFLIMLVVVRERRREIGVLKAIGAGNGSIMKQFMTEALVLIVLGSVVGVGVAYGASGPIAQSLVTSNTTSTTTQQAVTGGRGGFGAGRRLGNIQTSQELVGKVATSIGLPVLLEGLGAALLIAIIGSAIPAWMTAKIRPAEVMRGE